MSYIINGPINPKERFDLLNCRLTVSPCVSLSLVMMIVLLRYAHIIEKHQNCVLNTASLSTGWICAAGLIVLGNFQVQYSSLLCHAHIYWRGALVVQCRSQNSLESI